MPPLQIGVNSVNDGFPPKGKLHIGVMLRGVVRFAEIFSLPLAQAQRAEADIPAKKRAMYRRRQALLDDVFTRLQAALPSSNHNLGLQGKQGDAFAVSASAVDGPPVVDSLK